MYLEIERIKLPKKFDGFGLKNEETHWGRDDINISTCEKQDVKYVRVELKKCLFSFVVYFIIRGSFFLWKQICCEIFQKKNLKFEHENFFNERLGQDEHFKYTFL